MSNLLVIFGVTGQQGASVANTVLEHEKLSKMYRVRGVTRDTSKPEARKLSEKGVEIVSGDFNDRAAIKSALKGAHAVFVVTVSLYHSGGFEEEIVQGKAIADEAVAAGAKFLVYSTVPSPKKLTNNKYTVGSWDCKDAVKDYIETLPIKSAFFAPGGLV